MSDELTWLRDAGAARPLAEIHATVELERALAEHAADAELTRAAVDDPLLGARVARIEVENGRRLALAEPSREGRLAATLARQGEGIVGRYIVAPVPLGTVRRLAASAAVRLSREAIGPYGPEILILAPLATGRLVVLVDPRAVPSPAMTDRQQITLRPAGPGDVERIATMFTDEGYPSGPSDIAERLGRFRSAESRVIVADNGGEVLGFIALHAVPRFEHSDRIVRIMALVVDAGVRERGIGRLLMEEAERIGAELGAAWSEVTAGHHRPDARRLYEELGYDASIAAYLRKRL